LKILTIDTSTTACSAALTDGEKITGEFILDTDRTLSKQLLNQIDFILRSAGMSIDDLDGLGVALGPGSFTGLRVGIATVKGLAVASDKPVAGFSSLAMLAMNLPWSAYQVCPMLDARKNEIYASLYRCEGLPGIISEDCVVSPADFLDNIGETTIFLGSGAVRYRELIESRLGDKAVFAPCYCNQPRASAGAMLAYQAFSRGETMSLALLNPSYIRPSEAEIKKMAGKDR
jgi:tRNA threonylcarbamoyladenosine biosynthesis protein TsaB